jgi:3-dehydroquinate synthase
MNVRNTILHQRITVPFEYPVIFTHALFDPTNPTLARLLRRAGRGPHRLLFGVDQGLATPFPRLIDDVHRYLKYREGLAVEAHPPLLVPCGEGSKNGWNGVREIMTAIGNAHLDRHSFVIAIGGGSLLDIVGFAAALVHRGIRLIRIPTTVLAQCDAAVGVKNGMDEHGQKNFIGTFAPPYAVLNDLDLLRKLPARYWTGGIAEIFKVALIKDAKLFHRLRRSAAALRRREAATIEPLVIRSARIHLEHIRDGGDPFEMGSARPLDFGHWSGHKLERLTHHRLGHGEAVAIGIALDVCYAVTQRLLTEQERDTILDALHAVGLPLWDEACRQAAPTGGAALLEGLEEFREHLGGRLTITLPRGIGARIEVNRVDQSAMMRALAMLRAAACERSRACA